jgi:hypothetical protein
MNTCSRCGERNPGSLPQCAHCGESVIPMRMRESIGSRKRPARPVSPLGLSGIVFGITLIGTVAFFTSFDGMEVIMGAFGKVAHHQVEVCQDQRSTPETARLETQGYAYEYRQGGSLRRPGNHCWVKKYGTERPEPGTYSGIRVTTYVDKAHSPVQVIGCHL